MEDEGEMRVEDMRKEEGGGNEGIGRRKGGSRRIRWVRTAVVARSLLREEMEEEKEMMEKGE